MGNIVKAYYFHLKQKMLGKNGQKRFLAQCLKNQLFIKRKILTRKKTKNFVHKSLSVKRKYHNYVIYIYWWKDSEIMYINLLLSSEKQNKNLIFSLVKIRLKCTGWSKRFFDLVFLLLEEDELQ